MSYKTLFPKKAIALYETHMRVGYVVKTVVFYLVAFILWYIIAVIAPYTATLTVDPQTNRSLTAQAFCATESEKNAAESGKERALLMPSSESAFMRRLRLVEDARSYIDHMVYDTYPGEYAEYYYTALLRAADRGVKVRILVDGKMGTLDVLGPLGDMLLNYDNVELYHFNGINPLDPAGLMTVMHDKVMIVDGDKMIVGGVNMGTGAFLNNYDMEVFVTNSGEHGCVGQARRYFESMLKSGLVKRQSSKKRLHSAKAEYVKRLDEFYRNGEFFDAEINYAEQGVAVDKITFLSNPISSGKKKPIILQALYNMMESSDGSLLVTPYTMLERDKRSRLRRAAEGKTEFDLVTNSLYNTRNVGYADYYYNRDKYLNGNIRIYEYQAKNQLHAKMFAFDDNLSVIGSFNLDERSAHIDTESVVIIDSERFNAQLRDYVNTEFVANSREVGNDNKYLPNAAVEAPPVPKKKRVIYALYSALGIVRCLI